ncbi:MAG: hypothetical protein QNJ22_05735 [Desulfosarcinaceae bacterium]|nr:hypothetical protein [Desulfosarcinaceae bacterium]
MAIHLLPFAKLAALIGKAGSSKAATAALSQKAGLLAAKRTLPTWLITGVLAGLVGFKLLFLLVLARKRNLFAAPTRIGRPCDACGHWLDLNTISRQFTAKLQEREFVFTGKCPQCEAILSIKDSALKERPKA